MPRELKQGKPWLMVRNIGGALYVLDSFETEEIAKQAVAENSTKKIRLMTVYAPEYEEEQ